MTITNIAHAADAAYDAAARAALAAYERAAYDASYDAAARADLTGRD